MADAYLTSETVTEGERHQSKKLSCDYVKDPGDNGDSRRDECNTTVITAQKVPLPNGSHPADMQRHVDIGQVGQAEVDAARPERPNEPGAAHIVGNLRAVPEESQRTAARDEKDSVAGKSSTNRPMYTVT